MNFSSTSKYEQQKQAANAAYDAHCDAWECLAATKSPTMDDLQRWLDAKNLLSEKQSEFEEAVREIFFSGLAKP